jgi:hypothetical protein
MEEETRVHNDSSKDPLLVVIGCCWLLRAFDEGKIVSDMVVGVMRQ